MDLPCKSSYLCKDLKEPLSHVYCHSCDLCLKAGKWPRASVLQNVYMYMLSMYSCVVWVLEFICIYLFIFNGRGTDCSFHKVLKCQEWESVDDTEATISRSTHKQWGWAGEHCAGFYSLQWPNCIRAADLWITIHRGQSFLSWDGTSTRLDIILLPHSAYCLHLFFLPSSVFLHPFLFTHFYPSPTLYS